MGIFSSILSKLGFGDDAAAETAAPAAPIEVAAAPAAVEAAVAAAPVAISPVDVLAKMDALAKANPEKLNWKVMGWSPLLETASEVPKCGEWKFPPSKRGDRNEAYDDWY